MGERTHTLDLSGVRVDLESGRFEGVEGSGRLSGRERAVLAAVARRAPRAVSRLSLLQDIWGTDDPRSRAVDVTWSRLRRKLEVDPSQPRHLLTIHGEGYRLELPRPPGRLADGPVSRGWGDVDAGPTLLGRQEALATVRRWHEGPGRWLTLCGPGGVGKTCLLEAVLRAHRAAGGVGVLIRLEEATEAEEALHAIARALGIGLRATPSLSAQIIRASRGRLMVWGLDNLEQLAEDARQLVSVAEACGTVRVVASSRRPVGDVAEAVLRLAGLDREASVALLKARLTALGAAMPPDEQALDALVTRTEGLPLALELAAARAARTSLAEAVEALGRLEDPTRPARHRSLGATLQASWEMLSEPGRDALAALSTFRGAIPEDAAEAVVDAGPEVLDTLADASLVQRHGDTLRLHPIVHRFATDALDRRDPQGRTRSRYRRFVLEEGARLGRAVHGPRPGPAMARARRLAEDLAACIQASRPGHHGDLLPVLPLLERWIPAQTDAPRWLTLLDRAAALARRTGEGAVADALDLTIVLASDRVLPGAERAKRLERLGATSPTEGPLRRLAEAMVRVACDAPDDAIPALRALLAEADLPEPVRCRAAIELGVALRTVDGPGERPEAHVRSALDGARALDDALLEAEASRELGALRFQATDYDEATAHLERARAVWADAGDARGQARALQVLCSIATYRQRLDEAVRLAREGLRVAPRGTVLRAILESRLGVCLRRQGHLDEALHHCRRAAALLEAHEADLQRVVALNHLASVYLQRDEVEAARETFEDTLALAERLGHPRTILAARNNLVEIDLRQGRHREALRRLDALLADPALDPYEDVHARSARAEALAVLDRRDEALAEIRRVIHWARPRHHGMLLAHSLLNLAQLHAHRGDGDAVRDALGPAQAAARINRYQVARIFETLGEPVPDGLHPPEADLESAIQRHAPPGIDGAAEDAPVR